MAPKAKKEEKPGKQSSAKLSEKSADKAPEKPPEPPPPPPILVPIEIKLFWFFAFLIIVAGGIGTLVMHRKSSAGFVIYFTMFSLLWWPRFSN